MGHLETGSARSRFDKTPREWLKAGAQLAEQANIWSERGDIVAFVGEGAGHGAPACFLPEIAEMEVDTAISFGKEADPRFIGDLTVRTIQLDHPVPMGAVLHEAMHAKHSLWDMREANKAMAKEPFEALLVTAFEETRIEKRGVAAFPENRSMLRACALHLVVGDLGEDKGFAERGLQSLSHLMLLTMARIDAGVLEPADVQPVTDAAVKMFGEDLVAKLRDIWQRAQDHRDDEAWAPLRELAREWIAAMEEEGHDPKKESEAPEWLKELLKEMVKGAGGPPSEDGEDGEDGEPSGCGGMGILMEMAEDAEVEANGEAGDQAAEEHDQRVADEKKEKGKEAKDHKDKATKTFGRGTGPAGFDTNSRLQQKRQPTATERSAAVRLSKDLERAKYRDRVTVKTMSAVPPGRLKMRSAMANSVQRSRGMSGDVEPWSAKRRFHTEDPELKIGVMVDISGSMRRAMEPMAASAWILSEAVRRIQGKVAMVYYGNDVFPVLKPGQHLAEVNVYDAADGTERFDKAFKALNGQMDLLDSSGARLLVVVSDLYHTANELEAAKAWFKRCRAEGVAVIVIPFDQRMRENAKNVVKNNGTVIDTDGSDIAEAGRLIGDAAVKMLAAASR